MADEIQTTHRESLKPMKTKTQTTPEPYIFTASEYMHQAKLGFWWGVLCAAPLWLWIGGLIGKAIYYAP